MRWLQRYDFIANANSVCRSIDQAVCYAFVADQLPFAWPHAGAEYVPCMVPPEMVPS